MEDTLIILFCIVDEFCKEFYPEWEKTLLIQGVRKRCRPSQISPSEIMTILIYFHMLRFRDFKTYYTRYVIPHLKEAFPFLPSYSHGEIMAFKLTSGNVDDRKPVPDLVKHLSGKLFGDKGYISQKLFETLFQQGLQLITRLKGNMKNKLMPLIDKLLLRKRSLVETVNDQLKNISQIEHTRHRSIWNFMVNILGGLAAYSLQPKKPSLNLAKNEKKLMIAMAA